MLTLTFLVGVFQLILGLARMGALVNFISHTVVLGFTAGAAILIAASQVRNFFGIPIPRGTPFYEILHQLRLHFFDINPWVLAVSLVTLATGILTKQTLQQIDEDNPLQKSVLLTCSGLSYIDIAGAEVLAQEARRRRRMGGGLYFYRLNETNMALLRKGGYIDEIGAGAFFPVMTNVTGALYWTLDPNVCRTCKTRIFKECRSGILPDGFRRQRLLLATDGSEFSRAAEELYRVFCETFGAPPPANRISP